MEAAVIKRWPGFAGGPVLFVQGTRNALGPLNALEDKRRRMTAPNALHFVEGGNHSLERPARDRAKQAAADSAILDSVRLFLDGALA